MTKKLFPWSHAHKVPETMGVLIPTFKRSTDLLRCLEALKTQVRQPDDILIVVRDTDTATAEALRNFDKGTLPIRVLSTDVPGTVHAHNIGIEACTTDILAMIDDDTAPQPEWLAVILKDFQRDPYLGGLGGRDFSFEDKTDVSGRSIVVGRVQWFGRCIGNHHRGVGEIQECDILKGANMSYRREALAHARCDPRLRGRGAQPSEDVSLSLAVKRDGWRIAYDPAALLYHYQSARDEIRHYSGQSKVIDPKDFMDVAYNEVISIWDFLSPVRKIAFVVWSLAIGTRVCPGLVQAFRFTPTLRGESWYRFWLVQRAKSQAFLNLLP